MDYSKNKNIRRMQKANERAVKLWDAYYATQTAWNEAKESMSPQEWEEYCSLLGDGICPTHDFYDLGA